MSEPPFVKLFEDEFLFLRDDVESGIISDEGRIWIYHRQRRYSVFCKKPYQRLKVYCGSQEWALETFHKEYPTLLAEALQEADTN